MLSPVTLRAIEVLNSILALNRHPLYTKVRRTAGIVIEENNTVDSVMYRIMYYRGSMILRVSRYV